MRLVFLASAFVSACAEDPREVLPAGCNGSESLCSRTLDDITVVRAHNAHATEARGYHPSAMNHVSAIPTQLADGVRALNIDVYSYVDEARPDVDLWTCHGFCELGRQPFVEVVEELRVFLAEHPREVLTLDFQMETDPASVVDRIAAGGLDAFAMVHPAGEPWPTLGEMIDGGDQLVVLGDGEPDLPAWYLDGGALEYGTPWGTRSAAELGCVLSSPALDHALFELENTITNPLASPEFAAEVNAWTFLLDRAERCAAEVGKNPNLLTVDYYEIGDAVAVAAELNGVASSGASP